MRNNRLGLAAVLALVASSPICMPTYTATAPQGKPTNTGRRAEKAFAALVKAEGKRQRRAAKRKGE